MGASVGFDTVTDYMTCADSTDFDNISEGCIEFWFRPRQLIDNTLGTNFYIFQKDAAGNNNGDAIARFTFDTGPIRGALEAVFRDSTTLQIDINSNGSAWGSGTRYHCAIQWGTAAGAFCMYIDGVKQTSTDSFGTGSYPFSPAAPMNWGLNLDNASVRTAPIDIDEIRMSTVARYGANFTPPEYIYSDASTLALWHCDEGVGTITSNSTGVSARDLTFGAAGTPDKLPVWAPAIAINPTTTSYRSLLGVGQ